MNNYLFKQWIILIFYLIHLYNYLVSSSSHNRGRPKIRFENCSDRSKRRKSLELSKLHCSSKLSYTTSKALRKDGNEDAAKLISEITQTTPSRAKKIRASWERQKKNINPTSMSTEEALSIIITASLSKFQYNILRSNAKKHNHELYPSYTKVLAAKIDSYPEGITEEKCEVTK